MKIAQVIDSLDPKYGGPPMVAFRLAAAQAAIGHDVRLVTSTEDAVMPAVDAAMNTTPHREKVARPILPVVRFGIPALSIASNRAAAEAMEREISAVDVVHFHCIWCGMTALGTQIARKIGKPYVMQPHGLLDVWSMKQSRMKKQIALALGVRKLLDSAGALLLLNADEKTGIEPMKLTTPIKRVIPNGVFLEEIDPLPPRGSFRAKHAAFLGDRPFVLFLSRLHYKKGLDYLADAYRLVASQIPEARLVVVGSDDGAGVEFNKRIAEYGLTDRVLLTGPLYGRDKIEVLADADVFCLPSRQEGFSVAILEALACGCPIVASEGCHFPEVQSAGAGYSVPLDAAPIAEAIVKVLRDPAVASQMRIAARKLVAEHYTWDVVARQTTTLYEDMLK